MASPVHAIKLIVATSRVPTVAHVGTPAAPMPDTLVIKIINVNVRLLTLMLMIESQLLTAMCDISCKHASGCVAARHKFAVDRYAGRSAAASGVRRLTRT